MNEPCQILQMNSGKIYAINNSVMCVFFFTETSKVLWETFFLKKEQTFGSEANLSLSSSNDEFLFKNYDMEYCFHCIFQNCYLITKWEAKLSA